MSRKREEGPEVEESVGMVAEAVVVALFSFTTTFIFCHLWNQAWPHILY